VELAFKTSPAAEQGREFTCWKIARDHVGCL
jgi:hypothetical protein